MIRVTPKRFFSFRSLFETGFMSDLAILKYFGEI